MRPDSGQLIVGRSIQTPGDLEAVDASLLAGAINGGTAQLSPASVIFRPRARSRFGGGGGEDSHRSTLSRQLLGAIPGVGVFTALRERNAARGRH
jgi:hypothetical protein